MQGMVVWRGAAGSGACALVSSCCRHKHAWAAPLFDAGNLAAQLVIWVMF